MHSRENEFELLLLAVLAGSLSEERDPLLADMLLRRIQRQLRGSESWDPEIVELLEHSLHHRLRFTSQRRMEEAREIATSVLEGFRRSFEETFARRLADSEEATGALRRSIFELTELVGGNATTVRRIGEELHTYLWMSSAGADLASARIVRYVPARLYLSDPLPERSTLDRIIGSVTELVDAVDLEHADEFPEETGSWWKRLMFKTKAALTHKEVTERLGKAERAVEIAYLDKPQAEANQCQAEAAARLIESLQSTTNACIQVGSLLVVKATNDSGESSIISRTLTPMELKRIEENQAVLRRPNEILEWLGSSVPKRLTRGQR